LQLLFDDYDFPRELWDSSTQTFTTPVDTLLTFCPHIVTQLKKDPREQEPIKQEKGTFEKFFESSRSNLASTFSTSMAERTFRFCVEVSILYLHEMKWMSRQLIFFFVERQQLPILKLPMTEALDEGDTTNCTGRTFTQMKKAKTKQEA
jgi:hypothetical protein